MTPEGLVNKLWSYCHVLRDDGVPVIAYVEQLTQLLFLKMAHERTQSPFSQPDIIPEGLGWTSLLDRSGSDLETHYRKILRELGKQPGTLGLIFRKATNHVQDPTRLKQLIVDLIDQETWSGLDTDVKGDAYEGLLQKGAEDTKSGAGQYFTPRPIIRAMVKALRPGPGDTICDPACGTGGFLLAAHEHITNNHALDREQHKHLRDEALAGWELVPGTARLCAMNLLLHGIGTPDGESRVHVEDALRNPPSERFSMVLANPPFGTKSSITIVADDGSKSSQKEIVSREDFWATTSNKQLNFLQHIHSILKVNGGAAVVLPDNVLFEGGAGETIRRRLLRECDLHTLLRLPTGIFYAQGVKANVLFFDRKPAAEDPWTKTLWVYDLRTNKHFTLKRNPLSDGDLEDFLDCYKPGQPHEKREETERFKAFTYDLLVKRDKANLDITWLRDESQLDPENLPDPDVLAEEIMEDLEAALAEFAEITAAFTADA